MNKYVTIMKEVALALQAGATVRDTATRFNMPYSTLCKQLHIFNITKYGKLIEGTLDYNEAFKDWLKFLSEQCLNIKNLADLLQVSRDKVSSIFSTAKIYVAWNLEDNHNELLAASRRAELFVKNLGYKVVRDCYTCQSASHQKAPYDLILEQWGSVDCKSTVLKEDKYSNIYAAFNTQNFTKGVKYAFLVVMDGKREDFLAVFAIPGKLVVNHSTIHITISPNISKKYKDFLIWKNEEIDFTELRNFL